MTACRVEGVEGGLVRDLGGSGGSFFLQSCLISALGKQTREKAPEFVTKTSADFEAHLHV